jgi:hypothetical protein
LTVRQMALLASMEEMTIRTAANPRHVRFLPTVPVEGRTLFGSRMQKSGCRKRGVK